MQAGCTQPCKVADLNQAAGTLVSTLIPRYVGLKIKTITTDGKSKINSNWIDLRLKCATSSTSITSTVTVDVVYDKTM